jgi:hypothetical protein
MQEVGLVVLYGSAVPSGRYICPMGLQRGLAKGMKLIDIDPSSYVTLLNKEADDIINAIAKLKT